MARVPNSRGRSNGSAVFVFHTPCRSGAPHAVRGAFAAGAAARCWAATVVPSHAVASVTAASRAPRYNGNRAVLLIAMPPGTVCLPLVSFVAFGTLAAHVEDDRIASPAFHQLVLAKVAEERFLDELVALELQQRRVLLELTVEHHAHLPRPREDVRIRDGHLVAQRIRRNGREPLDDVERVGVEVARAREPGAIVEVGHVGDQRVALPAADRVAHPLVGPRLRRVFQENRAAGVGVREEHLDLAGTLRDLERIRHLSFAPDARELAPGPPIATEP